MPAPTNHVFVDFENVPSVDLAAIAGKPVQVTLLIGEKQRRLDLRLVRQIHEHAAQVALIEVGASGRNALDLVLAWHLGRAAETHPGNLFFVVSKDKDFDPLVAHLRGRGLEVARVDAFATLPFLARPAARKTAPQRRAATATPEAETPPSPAEPDPRLAKLIDRLQHKTKSRPVRRRTLVSHIHAFFGNQLPDSQVEAIVSALQRRGVIAIDDNGRVSYPSS